MTPIPASSGELTIGPMTHSDWPTVGRIYANGIATGNTTFETETPEWGAWDRGHLLDCRQVARGDNTVVAWAALSPVSARACYSGVAEHSIYVDENCRGQGVGKALLREFVRRAGQSGFWTLQSSIFPENAPSIAIQLACGFRVLGRRKKAAMLHGVWRDTLIVEWSGAAQLWAICSRIALFSGRLLYCAGRKDGYNGNPCGPVAQAVRAQS